MYKEIDNLIGQPNTHQLQDLFNTGDPKRLLPLAKTYDAIKTAILSYIEQELANSYLPANLIFTTDDEILSYLTHLNNKVALIAGDRAVLKITPTVMSDITNNTETYKDELLKHYTNHLTVNVLFNKGTDIPKKPTNSRHTDLSSSTKKKVTAFIKSKLNLTR